MRVVISGSSGLIGRSLAAALGARGDDVTVAGPPAPGRRRGAVGPRGAGSIDAGALEGADAVVHLAGAGIGDKRWSAGPPTEILSSRVKSTTLLAADPGRARTAPGRARERIGRRLLRRPGRRGADRGQRGRGRGSWPRCAGPGRTPPAPPTQAGDPGRPPALGGGALAARRSARTQLPLFRAGLGGQARNRPAVVQLDLARRRSRRHPPRPRRRRRSWSASTPRPRRR